jgi:hypothetical protein
MNTPSHLILNLAVLGGMAPVPCHWAIALGAILPDLPIFGFYGWAKGIARLPDAQIWSTTYFEPGWQVVFAISHSIPLAVAGLAIAYRWKQVPAMLLFASMILHSLLDLPVHHDDAHHHFYPLSHYRLISPVSYWDVNHYGAVGALVELILVIIATGVLLSRGQPRWGTGLLLAVNGFYAVGYLRLYGSQWF